MPAKNSAALTVTTPTEREIVMTRVFDAPRRLVFDAYTNPEHLPHWLLGSSRRAPRRDEVCVIAADSLSGGGAPLQRCIKAALLEPALAAAVTRP